MITKFLFSKHELGGTKFVNLLWYVKQGTVSTFLYLLSMR